VLTSIAADIRYAARALRKTPAFTIGAMLTLALAIGATTAIYSVVHGVLMRQLPYASPERTFWIWSDQPGRDRTPFNVPDFVDYRDRNQTLDGFAGFFAFNVNLSDGETAERVQGLRATGDFFRVLGAAVSLGRLLEPGDEGPGSEHVVVLADTLWRRRFGGNPHVVGTSIRVNSERYTVVGVLAPHFVTPVRDVELVVPFVADADPRRGARNSVNFIIGAGRLRGGVSFERARDDLSTIARRLREQFPVENARKAGVRLVPLVDGIVGNFRTALLAVFAAVAAVLLIACANLANLMLSRALARRKEVAVRLALGGTRMRLVQQFLTEAVVLGGAGGAAGLLVAEWGRGALLLLAPQDLPRLSEIALDTPVLVFSMGVSLLTGVLFGVVPAFASARIDLRDALHGSARGSTTRGGALRATFVAWEVTLAFVLLVVVTMFVKSYANVLSVTPGFEPSHTLSARLALPAARFNDREAILRFEQSVQQRLASLPTVVGAGAINVLPLSGVTARVPFAVEGRTIDRARIPFAQFRIVSPGYFEAMRIPLVRGRSFSERDTNQTQPIAVVNTLLASSWFGDQDPIGKRLLVDDNDGPPRPIAIAGVVGNVKQLSLDGEPTWDLYLTYSQIHKDTVGLAAANMFVVVRSAGDASALTTGLSREVHAVDGDVAAAQIQSLDQYLSSIVAPRRFNVFLLLLFSVAAFALALTGIYAVTSYGVHQRRRELGIRRALGATTSNVVRLVIADSARPTLVGVAIGVPLAAGAARLVSAMLFGVAPNHYATFVEVAAGVLVAAAVACAIPAIGALRAHITLDTES